MKDFVKNFLCIADIDNGNVRVGVMIYDSNAHAQFQLSSYGTKMEVFDAIDKISHLGGGTNTADALKTMGTVMYTPQNGDRAGVPNICVLLTDDTSISDRTILKAEQATAEGIHIYAIVIDGTNTRELHGNARKPVEENLFAVQEFSDLPLLRDKVFESFCQSKCTYP
nr:hypothetical protein BaRGS_014813 [Batillaria attramentaria]